VRRLDALLRVFAKVAKRSARLQFQSLVRTHRGSASRRAPSAPLSALGGSASASCMPLTHTHRS
jgi:hypothetical protein